MNNRFRIIIFPFLAFLLLLLIVAQNWSLLTHNRDSVVYTYLQSFKTGVIGSGYGYADAADIPYNILEPGDILLGGWPNCAYGKYSHAGLYLGGGEVLEAYVDYGVCIQPLGHYGEYTDLCFIRVNVDEKIKSQIISTARHYNGKMFYPVAFKQNDHYYNCSSIIWKAYKEQGINLDCYNDIWIAPDSFRSSPYVNIIFEKGM